MSAKERKLNKEHTSSLGAHFIDWADGSSLVWKSSVGFHHKTGPTTDWLVAR